MRSIAAPGALGLLTLATAALVCRDGAPGWCAVRLLMVACGAAAGAAALRVGEPGPPVRRRVAALAVVLLGIAGTGEGVGIGVMHLVAGAVGPVAVAGLAALLAGLVLLAVGARRLLRTCSRRGMVLAAPGVVILVAALLPPLSLAVMATNVPAGLVRGTPATLAGLHGTTVQLRAPDGVRLSAVYVPSRNRAAVLLLHGSGARSSGASVVPQARVLMRHGYGVLLLDARGHGRSGGDAMDFGWYGERDVPAALRYLAGRPDVDPGRIAVLGESMGGEQALGALAGYGTPRVAAVVAEGATARTARDKAAWLPGGAAGFVQRRLDSLTYALAGALTSAPQPPPLASAVRAGAAPVLLICAGRVADEQRAAEALQRAAPDRVRIWSVAGAGHTGGLKARPAAWERQVVGFLDRALLGSAPGGEPL